MKQKLEIVIEEETKGAEKKKFCRPFVIFGILGSLILTWATTGSLNDSSVLFSGLKLILNSFNDLSFGFATIRRI